MIIIIIQRVLPDNADGNVEMQENNDANQQHIDDAIDEEGNGYMKRCNAVQNAAQHIAVGKGGGDNVGGGMRSRCGHNKCA